MIFRYRVKSHMPRLRVRPISSVVANFSHSESVPNEYITGPTMHSEGSSARPAQRNVHNPCFTNSGMLVDSPDPSGINQKVVDSRVGNITEEMSVHTGLWGGNDSIRTNENIPRTLRRPTRRRWRLIHFRF